MHGLDFSTPHKFSCISTEYIFLRTIHFQKIDPNFRLLTHGSFWPILACKILVTGNGERIWTEFAKRIHPGAHRARLGLSKNPKMWRAHISQNNISQNNTSQNNIFSKNTILKASQPASKPAGRGRSGDGQRAKSMVSRTQNHTFAHGSGSSGSTGSQSR